MLRSDTSMSAIRRTRATSSSVTKQAKHQYEDTAETNGCTICYFATIVSSSVLYRHTLLDQPRIELSDKETADRTKPVFVNITHHGKFVGRIFNNGTFDDEFYGGWWQRIDGSYRKAIRMNNLDGGD